MGWGGGGRSRRDNYALNPVMPNALKVARVQILNSRDDSILGQAHTHIRHISGQRDGDQVITQMRLLQQILVSKCES